MFDDGANNGRGGAAFFDLDRTLIDVNSGTLYAKYEYRNGRIRRWQLIQSMLWAGAYHLSLLPLDKALRKALAHYRGMPEAALVDRTHEWFEEEVAGRMQPGARAAIEEHRAQAQPVVLLTNSSAYMAREATRAFGLDDWLANRFLVDDQGRLTGDFEAPLCYGDGKVARAESWARKHEVDLAASTFYSDSYSDLPMLRRVGHPQVVNPDPRLKRYARRVGWPILDWTE